MGLTFNIYQTGGRVTKGGEVRVEENDKAFGRGNHSLSLTFSSFSLSLLLFDGGWVNQGWIFEWKHLLMALNSLTIFRQS